MLKCAKHCKLCIHQVVLLSIWKQRRALNSNGTLTEQVAPKEDICRNWSAPWQREFMDLNIFKTNGSFLHKRVVSKDLILKASSGSYHIQGSSRLSCARFFCTSLLCKGHCKTKWKYWEHNVKGPSWPNALLPDQPWNPVLPSQSLAQHLSISCTRRLMQALASYTGR